MGSYDWFTFVVLTLVAYRVTHLFVMDTLFEGWRDKFLDRITTATDPAGVTRPLDKRIEPELWSTLPLWRRKVFELITCVFCLGFWIAGAVVLIHDAFIDPNLPYPVWYWVAISTSALIVWAIVDGHD